MPICNRQSRFFHRDQSERGVTHSLTRRDTPKEKPLGKGELPFAQKEKAPSVRANCYSPTLRPHSPTVSNYRPRHLSLYKTDNRFAASNKVSSLFAKQIRTT